MGFYDKPIIDKNAERSEESVLKTRTIFSKKNGFISHVIDGSNDYGVDINCQLSLNNMATEFSFPIQVKSKISYKDVSLEGSPFKAFSFATSRLGHLIRHTPISGLIVIYDETEQRLFFESAYVLYNRVRELQKDESWKKQDSITLHIAKDKTLDEKHIADIHTMFLNQFKRHEQLLVDHGPEYDLPIATDALPQMSAPEFLSQYGEELFNAHRFQELNLVLEKLSKSSFREKQICYLGALVYVEIGNFVDADYCFKLCNKHISRYTAQQLDTLSFQKYQLEYYIGQKTREELREILQESAGPGSQALPKLLTLKLNLLELDLRDFAPEEEYDTKFIDSLTETLKEIETSDLHEKNKQNLLVNAATLLSKAITPILMSMLFNTKISKALNINPGSAERIKRIETIRELNSKSWNYLTEGLKFAEDSKDELLEAYAKYSLSFAFFGHCFAYHSSGTNWTESSPDDLLESAYSGAIKAYNLFNRKGMKPVAYRAISLAREVHALAAAWVNLNLDHVVKRSDVERVLEEFGNSDFKIHGDSLLINFSKMKDRLDSEA